MTMELDIDAIQAIKLNTDAYDVASEAATQAFNAGGEEAAQLTAGIQAYLWAMQMLTITTHTVIFYSQYHKWVATLPFESRKAAERHADLYLRQPGKEYIRDITFLEVTLPQSTLEPRRP